MLKHKEQLLEARKTLEEKRERARSYVKETAESIQSLRRELEDNNRKRKETSQRESGLQETLNETMKRLTEFKVDRRESEREHKLSECIQNLKKLFSGIHGRVIDLCRPAQKKYDLAVSTILGKNMDAIVVDDEKIAMECIEVSGERCLCFVL